jgi:hypothetical protein
MRMFCPKCAERMDSVRMNIMQKPTASVCEHTARSAGIATLGDQENK